MKANIDQLATTAKLLIKRRETEQLRQFLDGLNISEAEALVDDLPEIGHILIDTLSINRSVNVFKILDTSTQERIIKQLSGDKITELINLLPPDDKTSLFGKMRDKDLLHRLISLLSTEDRSEVLMLLSYPEDSVGRLMTPYFVAMTKEHTVQQALEYIRLNGQNSETIDVIYIVDNEGVLIDDLRIRELLLCSPQTLLCDLMDDRLIYLEAMAPMEDAIQLFKMNNRVALPVIDNKGVILGIVTIDDILWIADDEYTEDMQRMGGTSAFNEPFLNLPIHKLIWKRAGWLIILFLGELLTASVMHYYEAQLERMIVLAMFLPLMISSGGNSGSQASTLVIQAMAVGEVKLRDWFKVFRREIISGLSLGIILGSVGFLRIFIWHYIFPNLYGEYWFFVGLTVSLALVGIVLWGSIIGAMLPFILRRFGADPATSSAPFVATIVDVTGLIIYLGIASWIFSTVGV